MKNSTFALLAQLFWRILQSILNYIKKISLQQSISVRTAGVERVPLLSPCAGGPHVGSGHFYHVRPWNSAFTLRYPVEKLADKATPSCWTVHILIQGEIKKKEEKKKQVPSYVSMKIRQQRRTPRFWGFYKIHPNGSKNPAITLVSSESDNFWNFSVEKKRVLGNTTR